MQIRKHKTLNLQVWNSDDSLKKSVSDILMRIMRSYIYSIRVVRKINIDETDVKDVFVYGSCANYFYTRKSDIDFCIVIDFDSVASKNPGIIANSSNFILYYYSWAMTHRCKIYGRKVDVSLEDAKKYFFNSKYRSGPCFSVMNNRWMCKPVPISDSEFKQICKQSRKIYKEIMRDYRQVKRDGFTMSGAKKLYSDIYDRKNAAHNENPEQPVTSMYIAFRKIRDQGILEKLRNRMVELESKDFVLK